MSHVLKAQQWTNGPLPFGTKLALMENKGVGLANRARPLSSNLVLFNMLPLTKTLKGVRQLHQAHPFQRINKTLLLQHRASSILAQ